MLTDQLRCLVLAFFSPLRSHPIPASKIAFSCEERPRRCSGRLRDWSSYSVAVFRSESALSCSRATSANSFFLTFSFSETRFFSVLSFEQAISWMRSWSSGSPLIRAVDRNVVCYAGSLPRFVGFPVKSWHRHPSNLLDASMRMYFDKFSLRLFFGQPNFFPR